MRSNLLPLLGKLSLLELLYFSLQLLLLNLGLALSSTNNEKETTTSLLGPDNGCRKMLRSPCKCDHLSVQCINAQFVDTDVFLQVGIHFSYLESVTFHGNNFNILPKALFGPTVKHMRLKSLNLSANYIVDIEEDSMTGMPDMEVLDLSYNEIVLKEDDVGLLKHLPKLKRLALRRTFNFRPPVNESEQLDLLERIFQVAQLKHLEVLDLSYNYLHSIPYNLGCLLPKLTHLKLAQNNFDSLKLNTSCFQNLNILDLTGNGLRSLDLNFRMTASLLPDYSIRLRSNPFMCDCNSNAYISWFQSSLKIHDKDLVVCYKASPRKYSGHKLVEVPENKLDCSIVLDGGAQLSTFFSQFTLLCLSLLCANWLWRW